MWRSTAPGSEVTSPSSSHAARGGSWVAEGHRGLAVEEHPLRRDQLEGVPLGRIVARGHRDAPGRIVVIHGEQDGRRRNDPDIDHVHADRLEAREHRPPEHRPGGPRVPPHDDRTVVTLRSQPGPEGGRDAGDEFGGHRGTDASADSGNADHQIVGKAYGHGRYGE